MRTSKELNLQDLLIDLDEITELQNSEVFKFEKQPSRIDE